VLRGTVNTAGFGATQALADLGQREALVVRQAGPTFELFPKRRFSVARYIHFAKEALD